MSTTESKLQRIITTKNDLKTVANNHGGEITEETPFSEYSGEFERVIGEKYEQGHADGVQSEYDRFWDIYQKHGSRDSYLGAFAGKGWTNETFKPKYDIVPTVASEMFRDTDLVGDFVEILNSCGVRLDVSGAQSMGNAFRMARVTRYGVIDIRNASSCTYVFYSCYELVNFDELIFPDREIDCNNMFYGVPKLQNIKISGVIAAKNLSFQWSNKLTRESLMSIINALKDYTEIGGSNTITLGSENKAKLTAEEIAIAENKGWRVL